MPPTA
jgi:2-polyprenyl-6-methoxyphenol hydroxylase-like FAD-dependent oxidoreductase